MASHEDRVKEAREQADYSVRKETKDQLVALNTTLAEVKDELKAVHEALATLSKTLIGINLSQNQ